jgi:lipoprotein-releasing system permease protein
MKYSFRIALRYLFARKSKNAVHFISRITGMGFLVGSFALIVIMSTLNGFESLIVNMYENFDPDFKIEGIKGKTMEEHTGLFNTIEQTPGLLYFHPIIEEQAVLKHYENQTACYIKGVPENYFEETGLNAYVLEGSSYLGGKDGARIIMGSGVDYKLKTSVHNPMSKVEMYTPSREQLSVSDPNILRTQSFTPSGVIYLDDQINQKYAFIPIQQAADLFQRPRQISYIEVRVNPVKLSQAEQHLKHSLPPGFNIKNRMQQQEALYRMFQSEKWVTFALLTFVMLLAAFNVSGSLTMLVVEKKKDIFTFKTMGATKPFIRRIFLYHGMMIAALGGMIGLVLGVFLVWLQTHFGFITMTGAIVEAYPVELKLSDMVLIFCTTLGLGFLTSFLPAWNAFHIK